MNTCTHESPCSSLEIMVHQHDEQNAQILETLRRIRDDLADLSSVVHTTAGKLEMVEKQLHDHDEVMEAFRETMARGKGIIIATVCIFGALLSAPGLIDVLKTIIQGNK